MTPTAWAAFPFRHLPRPIRTEHVDGDVRRHLRVGEFRHRHRRHLDMQPPRDARQHDCRQRSKAIPLHAISHGPIIP